MEPNLSHKIKFVTKFISEMVLGMVFFDCHNDETIAFCSMKGFRGAHFVTIIKTLQTVIVM